MKEGGYSDADIFCESCELPVVMFEIQSFLQIGDDYEWISTDWLRQWLNPDQVNIPPIDNTSLMCKHSCADPLKLNMMKRVSAEAAEVLFTRHGGLPRLKSDSLCTTCTESIKRGRDFETQLQADMKAFVKPLKTSYK